MRAKDYSLVLSKSYQPVRIVNYRRCMRFLVGDLADALDPVSWEKFGFWDWVNKHNQGDFVMGESDNVSSAYHNIPIPEVLILKRDVKFGKKHNPNAGPRFSKRKVFQRDNFTCGYCGETGLKGDNLTIDHVVPQSHGGGTTYKNCVTACGHCNHVKADIPFSVLQKEGWVLNHKLVAPDNSLLLHVPESARKQSWETFIK